MQAGDFGLVPSGSFFFDHLETWWCRSRFTHVISGLHGGYLDPSWPRLRAREGDSATRYPLVLCSPDFTEQERAAIHQELLNEVGSSYSLLGFILVGLTTRLPFLAVIFEPIQTRLPHKAFVCSTAYTCAVARVGPSTYAKLRLPAHLYPHEVDPGHLAQAWGLL